MIVHLSYLNSTIFLHDHQPQQQQPPQQQQQQQQQQEKRQQQQHNDPSWQNTETKTGYYWTMNGTHTPVTVLEGQKTNTQTTTIYFDGVGMRYSSTRVLVLELVFKV